MKLVINYDFFNAILDVNEKFNGFKVIRNNKKFYKLAIPIWLTFDIIYLKKIIEVLLSLIFQIGFKVVIEYTSYLFDKIDIYEIQSHNNLRLLANNLQNLNVNTDYNLLLESEYDGREYSIQINENKIPEIIENKYILVPVYDYNGEIKNQSIVQEHVIGTNNYVLSIGRKNKVKKMVYSSAT